MYIYIVLGAAFGVAAIVLLASYICFRMAFFAKKEKCEEEFPLPPGKIYEPYHGVMRGWMQEARKMPYTEVSVTSFDGLRLYGKYYEGQKGAVTELMFHGYRGSAERDLCGGVNRAFALGHNVLIVDQRTAGKSEGNVITFGINESRDCRTWVDFIVDRFGKDAKIILTGISMGAATVLIAAGRPLPPSVVGVLADCGYTSAREMIKKTIREMNLPADLLYPFVKLGARLYGRFDLEETTPLESVKNCTLPVIFLHGASDGFVPCEMSRRNFEACPSRKALYTVKGADHGLAFPADPDGYLSALEKFFGQQKA